MKNILVLGAGRSAITLIKYLLDNSKINSWFITVADSSKELAEQAVGNHEHANAILFNVTDKKQRKQEIENADIVISMLPACMHILVAEDCLNLRKNLITASYVSKKVALLDKKAKEKNVLLLNEIGLDPGIDHMSAMQVIDKIRDTGGQIISFKSFCGGLVHPDYDNNPWNYKFTWNPRNVVLAGQGMSQYIKNGKYKYIPYTKLFELTEQINILDAGEFEGYANRDSLKYREAYGLHEIPTLFRGTLRRKGFSQAWNIFVQLGMTDDSYKIEDSISISNREFTNMLLFSDDNLSVEDKFCKQFGLTKKSVIFKKMEWLGVFTDERMKIKDGSPAQILQEILERKWSLGSNDKDMIVMQHQFEYIQKGKQKKLNSSLLVIGDGPIYTAMAKTVGLPVAIATKLILNGSIKSVGVKIPITKDIYIPILKELEENRINFIEELV